MAKKDPSVFFHETSKSCLIIMKFILKVKNHYLQQDLSWFSMKLFISFDTDQNLFLSLLGSESIISNIQRSLMCPCFLIHPSVIVLYPLSFRSETWEQMFLQVFFFVFSKKGIFKGYFYLFFDREEQSKKNFYIIIITSRFKPFSWLQHKLFCVFWSFIPFICKKLKIFPIQP